MTEKLLIFPQKLFVPVPLPLAHSGVVAPDVTAQLKVRLINLFDESGLANPEDCVWEGSFEASMNVLAPLAFAGAGNQWIETAINSSVNGSELLLHRLKRDLPAIREHFFDGAPPGQLKSVASGFSDSHNGGASVSVITFASGKQLVYKPRDMGIEAWFFELATWMQRAGAPLPVRAMKVLPQRGFGWMEFCAHLPCRDESQLHSFYKNAGALLCLLHLLFATDCHLENIIACGELPVLVDTETVFQPQFVGENSGPSPVRTGMLPSWIFGPAGEAYDLSAFGCVRPRLTHLEIPTVNGNTVEFALATLNPVTNVPFLQGQIADPSLYAEAIEEGFSLTWHFLAANRQELLSLVRRAAHEQIRFVPRDTLEYYLGLSATLLDGSDEVKLRAFEPPRSILEALRPDELSALQRLDIPRFTLEAGSRNLNGIIDVFPVSGCEAACALIEGLEEVGCDQSIKAIRASWGLFGLSRSFET